MRDRLKLARKRAGLSQRDLADRCGLSQPAISELERGKSGSTSYAAQLAAVLGVSALWLASGEGAMLPEPGFVPVPAPSAPPVNKAVARADAFLECSIVAAEQALQVAQLESTVCARKIRSALALLRDARSSLGLEQ